MKNLKYSTEVSVNGMYNYLRRDIKKIESKDIFKTSLLAGAAFLGYLAIQYFLSSVYFIVMSLNGIALSDSLDLIMYNEIIGYLFNAVVLTASFIIPFVLSARISGMKVRDIGMFAGVSRRVSYRLLLLFAFGAFMAGNILSSIFADIITQTTGFAPTQSVIGDASISSVPEALYLILCVAVIPAFIEEFAFRGILLGMFRKYGDMPAVIVTSILFALVHANFVQIPFALICGFALGLITVISKSIWPAIAAHFINNTFSVLSMLVPETSFLIMFFLNLFMYTAAGFGIFCLVRMFKKGYFEYIDKAPSHFSPKNRVCRMLLSPTLLISAAVFLSTAFTYFEKV